MRGFIDMKRKTNQQAAIQDVFPENDRPLSVEAILSAGRKIVGTLNQATVCRNLKILVEEGMLKYTRERKHFLCMREDFCRKARKD